MVVTVEFRLDWNSSGSWPYALKSKVPWLLYTLIKRDFSVRWKRSSSFFCSQLLKQFANIFPRENMDGLTLEQEPEELQQQAAVIFLPRPGLVTSDSPTLMGILTLGNWIIHFSNPKLRKSLIFYNFWFLEKEWSHSLCIATFQP